MIPADCIDAWDLAVPWDARVQVAHDLAISRALIVIFSDELLRRELRFRGGTALHKLHFPKPLRFSEDIDLVRTTKGPIGAIVGNLRDGLQTWLGQPKYKRGRDVPKLLFAVDAGSAGHFSLKVEINIREIESYDPPVALPFAMANPWCTGQVRIPTYSNEEIMATKLRALLQRSKGRDLYDIGMAFEALEGLNGERIVEIFLLYMGKYDKRITRAIAQERLFSRLASPEFLADLKRFLPSEQTDAMGREKMREFFRRAFRLAGRLPGEPWARTEEMRERFRFDW